MQNVKRILCPIDFSDATQPAMDLASRLCRDDGSKLYIVHVAASKDDPETQKLFLTIPAATNVVFERDLLEGDTVEEILNFAEREDIDLIVIGSHGRTGLRRVLMGSIAEQIVRRSPIPVMTMSMKATIAAGIDE